ncbi:MAG: AAA family ATPase [Eubacteriales bacterium]|nr:AAA family ATPase [Eubacteriales bacterium]
MSDYLSPLADRELHLMLQSARAVLIEGNKWCGKTRTAEQAAQSALYMQDSVRIASCLMAAAVQPSLLLAGDVPRLIDEWQLTPAFWDTLRFAVDQRRAKNQFILAGSSVPPKDSMSHSGAGRIARMRMWPMSLFESGEYNGTVSLQALYNGQHTFSAASSIDLHHAAYLIARGGWPASMKKATGRPCEVHIIISMRW